MKLKDKDLIHALGNVRKAAIEIWEIPKHKYYTDHTVKHSERVISILEGLTSGIMRGKSKLSDFEIYILLSSAYLHDIGMQNECFNDANLETIREEHEKITYEMIINSIKDSSNYRSLGMLPEPDIVKAIGLVSMGHRNIDSTFAGACNRLTY